MGVSSGQILCTRWGTCPKWGIERTMPSYSRLSLITVDTSKSHLYKNIFEILPVSSMLERNGGDVKLSAHVVV